MKKFFLMILTLALVVVLSGLGTLCHATSPTPPPPPPPPPSSPKETDSPLMLDTKPELATPKPQPPMDLRAPGTPEGKVPPGEKKKKTPK